MSHNNTPKNIVWNKPWKYKEGTAVCIGIALVGQMLQLSTGPINWDLMAWPANGIFLALYTLTIILAYALRHKAYAIRWSMTYHAAVPAILISGLATLVYGVTCDRSTLSAWPFVLLYFWLTTILGITCIKRWRSPSFMLNHLGLYTAIVAATLGSADMQKLKMTVEQEQVEWRAVDDAGRVHELDIAIKLNHFAIEEYPPKLVIIDNETGHTLPAGQPAALVLEDSTMTGQLMGHTIRVEKLHQYCAQYIGGDTINYVPWAYTGATTAALVSVDGAPAAWISNGSYMFPYRPIRIDSLTSIVMPECEPRRFVSNVDLYSSEGNIVKDVDIEVNKPFDIQGWKVYQLSYDNAKGRWSNISVFELVSDPWLPIVYAGIFMLLAGALWMFITAGGKKS